MGILKKLIHSEKMQNLAMQIASAGISVLQFSFLARILSKEDFGNWILFMSVFGFLETVRNGLFFTPLSKYLNAAKDSDSAAHWKIVTSLNVQFSFLISLILFIIAVSGESLGVFSNSTSQFLYFSAIAFVVSALNASAIWFANAKQKFFLAWILRFQFQLLFIISLLMIWYYSLSFEYVFFSFCGLLLFSSFLVLLISFFPKIQFSRSEKQLKTTYYKFGRYSMATVLGSNLLRSSDTFLIAGFIGKEAVAVYGLAMRIVELFEIPLRAWSLSSMPRLSRFSSEVDLFKQTFLKELSSIASLSAIAAIGVAIFAVIPVKILGGEGFEAAVPIVQIFMLYCAILPLDRFTGIALDMLGMPQKNTLKVILMLAVNVIGDCLVLYFFESIFYTALVSVLTFGTGVLFGRYLLKHQFTYSFPLVYLIALNRVLKTGKVTE